MRKLFRSQRGAIPVGIAVLLLVTSLLGLAAGYKAVQTPTKTETKAQATYCTNIKSVTPESPITLNSPFTCIIEINDIADKRDYICGIQKKGTNDWPVSVCNHSGVNADSWTGNKVKIPCNSSTNPYIASGQEYHLIAFKNTPACVSHTNNNDCPQPGNCNPDKALGVTKSADFTIGSTGSPPPTATPATPPPAGTGTTAPTQPPAPPPGGSCFWISAEFNKTDVGDFDAWVTFNAPTYGGPSHHIYLLRNGGYIAGPNLWHTTGSRSGPFTYEAGQFTGGRIPANTTVSFTGRDDDCGGAGNQSNISCILTVNSGTPSVSGSPYCRLRGSGSPAAPTATTAPSGPAATATTAPAPSGATSAPGTCPDTSCEGCILKYASGILNTFQPPRWPKNTCDELKNIVNHWCSGRVSPQGQTDCNNIKTNSTQCLTQCGSVPSPTPIAPTATNTPSPTPSPEPGTGSITGNVKIQGTVPEGKTFILSLTNYPEFKKTITIDNPTYKFYNITPGEYSLKIYSLDLLLNQNWLINNINCQGKTQTSDIACSLTVLSDKNTIGPDFIITMITPTPRTTATTRTEPEAAASGQGRGILQTVGYTVVNAASRLIPGLQSLQPQEVQVSPTSISGNVKINNTAGVTIDSVLVLLHKDKLDLSPLKANAISGSYSFDNLENKDYVIKAWVRDSKGRFFQNRPCTATGDDYDCVVKPGQKKDFVIDIGPQGARGVIIRTQQFSQETLTNLQKLVYNFPVLGPYIQMFVISAF